MLSIGSGHLLTRTLKLCFVTSSTLAMVRAHHIGKPDGGDDGEMDGAVALFVHALIIRRWSVVAQE